MLGAILCIPQLEIIFRFGTFSVYSALCDTICSYWKNLSYVFYFHSENPRADLKSNSFCCRRKIWPAIAAFSVQMGMAIIWSAAMNKWYYASFEKTVVVYDLYQNRQSMDAIEDRSCIFE